MVTSKFWIGERVIVDVPRDDIYSGFDGKTGIINRVISSVSKTGYIIKFDKSGEEIQFSEEDLKMYREPSLLEQHMELECPECGKPPKWVTPLKTQKVKIVLFECLFSATFDIDQNVEEMQKRLDEAKKTGKLGSFGIKGELK